DRPFDAAYRPATGAGETSGRRQLPRPDGDRLADLAVRRTGRCPWHGRHRRPGQPARGHRLPSSHRHRPFGSRPRFGLAPGTPGNGSTRRFMKIVQVQTQAEAAGAQRVSDMVGAGLRARGHEVRTIFMYRKTAAYDHDPHVDFVTRNVPTNLAGQLRAAMGLIAYLRKARPDAVISYQHYGNVFGTIGGRLAGARRIVANQSGAPQHKGMPGIASLLDKWMGSL